MFQASKRGAILALLILAIGSGCNTITRRAPRMPWQDKDEEEYGEPAKLVAIWKDQVMVPSGGRPTRGFGGRVYFYDATQKPIRVRGTFTVYAYDDDAQQVSRTNKPDRKFVFDECDLQSHYSASKIGHSYSFWIPWDAMGGEQRCITLAPFFQAEGGSLVSGEQSRTILLGHAKPEETLPPAEQVPRGPVMINYATQPASYVPPGQQPLQQPMAPQPTLNREHLRTTTIPVPSMLEQRLMMQGDTSGINRQPITQPTVPTPPPVQTFNRYQPRTFYQQGAAQYQNPPATNYPAAPVQYQQQPVPPQYRDPRQPQAGGVQTYQPWQREGAGGMHAGVNIRNFRPDFANSAEFSEYLATGRRPTGEEVAALPATHSLPPQPLAPSSQTVPPQFSGPQIQPNQSTWPQSRPSQLIR